MKKNISKYLLYTVIIFFLIYISVFFNSNKKVIVENGNSPMLLSSKRTVSSNKLFLADSSFSTNSSVENSEKLIKDYSLSIEVKDSNEIKNKIQKTIDDVKEIKLINFNSFPSVNNQLSYNWTLKILNTDINKYIDIFKSYGIIKSESSSTINLTDTYNDNENVLKNLYVRRDNLRKLMNANNSKLADILSIDKELSKVQNEIEKLEFKNKKIDDNANYSKLNLFVIQETKINELSDNKWSFKKSFKTAINKLILFTQLIINFIFITIFFIPYILIIYIIYKIILKFNE